MANQEKENEPIILAVVEGGGTSFVVVVAEVSTNETDDSTKSDSGNNNHPQLPAKILHRSEIDSSHDNPTKTLEECAEFFVNYKPSGGYHALGIACFGPVGLDVSSDTMYGCILPSTPKRSWRSVDLITPLAKACQGSSKRKLAIKIDTDVNAPAYAEYMLAKQDDPNISSVAYMTVGTGIGVGLVIHGKPVHGRMHPEGGKFCVPTRNLTFDCVRKSHIIIRFTVSPLLTPLLETHFSIFSFFDFHIIIIIIIIMKL